ncbi:MAG: hypothetical protein Q8Q85_04090 [Gemmatimonadales bacterium]|jgi:hypothetical protein|nr:hypothetical protein [Gemmatimonadales bacterium]
MSKSDEQRMAALIRKNAAKVAQAKAKVQRNYDSTLQPQPDDDPELRAFFSEMKKREF